MLKGIFIGAFTPAAIGRSTWYYYSTGYKIWTCKRTFSNEAGIGSTPHSHAVADTKHPAEQGFAAMIGYLYQPFNLFITVMLNLTSDIILIYLH